MKIVKNWESFNEGKKSKKCMHKNAYLVGGHTCKCPDCDKIILPNGDAIDDMTDIKKAWQIIDSISALEPISKDKMSKSTLKNLKDLRDILNKIL